MSSVNAAASRVCAGKLSDPLLLDLRCGTDRGLRSPCGGRFLKTEVCRFCLGAGVDDACLCYVFVACEEIRQPLQFYAILAENAANVFTDRRLRKALVRCVYHE